jgi:hypothetical protein
MSNKLRTKGPLQALFANSKNSAEFDKTGKEIRQILE